jgi:hypothetical protein
MVEKVRIGDYGAGALRHEGPSSAKKASNDGTDEFSNSPG